MNFFFQSVTTYLGTAQSFLVCTAASLILGILIAFTYMFKSRYNKSYVVTLAILPVIVQVVIMFVNGNLGTGVAVAGAFSLVRFRSVPGNAKEIGGIFIAMALGLGTGMGYLGTSFLFTIVVCGASLLYYAVGLGNSKKAARELKITIPEGLDYTDLFDDVFQKYTASSELIGVKTTNMGSLYRLFYTIELKDIGQEKAMIDEIRCRNGNLEIVCSKAVMSMAEQL